MATIEYKVARPRLFGTFGSCRRHRSNGEKQVSRLADKHAARAKDVAQTFMPNDGGKMRIGQHEFKKITMVQKNVQLGMQQFSRNI